MKYLTLFKQKSLLLTSIILIGLSSGVYAQESVSSEVSHLDSDGRIVNAPSLSHKNVNDSSGRMKSAYGWSQFRNLTEVNIDDYGIGYPYISGDGLRLYFTKSDQDKVKNLYMVSRESVDAAFDHTQLLDSTLFKGALGCWLTNDELEIYFKQKDSIYYSSRSSLSDPFSTPQKVELKGNLDGFITGVSLTPNKQELYLYHSDTLNQNHLLKLISTGNLSYTLSDTLMIPEGNLAGAGQLSKDGLKYYAGLKFDLGYEDWAMGSELFVYERNHIDEPFGAPQIVDAQINQRSFVNSHPTLTADETILVWVCSDDDLWTMNRLYQALKYDGNEVQEVSTGSVILYPNPAKDWVHFQGLEFTTEVQIFNLSGQQIKHEQVLDCSMNIACLPKGVYTVKIDAANNQVYRLIKK